MSVEFCLFFCKQKTAYEIQYGLVGSEMCIRDRGDVKQIENFILSNNGNVKFSTKSIVSANLPVSNIKLLNKELFVEVIDIPTAKLTLLNDVMAVSYTHLTLPTSDLVQISVVAVSLKKKKRKRTRVSVRQNHRSQRYLTHANRHDKQTQSEI